MLAFTRAVEASLWLKLIIRNAKHTLYAVKIANAELNVSLLVESGPWIDGPSFGKDAFDAVKRRKFGRLSHFMQVIDDGAVKPSKHKIFTASILWHIDVGSRAIV